jgi:hypothetical protein
MTIERPTLPPAAEPLHASQAQIARRGLLCGVATIPAVTALAGVASLMAAPALSASALKGDPIFAAIEAHRAANAAHEATLAEVNRLQDEDFHAVDVESITGKACDDENEAFEILLGAPATTLQGLLAKLDYLRGIAESDDAWMLDERDGGSLLLIDSITASLRNVGVLS